MDKNSIPARGLAIAAGVAFTGGALYILLEDTVRNHHWTMEHALSVLTVFGAIASGHLASAAWPARKVAAAGFVLLFVAATALTVYNSVGRQAETTETKTLDAEATNKALASKGAELERARQRLSDANDAADRETSDKRCGQKCKDWKLRATEVQANIGKLEGEIQALGPAKPVQPKASKGAQILAIFGFDEAKAKAALILLEPFFNTLLFEVGAIVSLGYAFGGAHVRNQRVSLEAAKPNSVTAKPNSVTEVANDTELPSDAELVTIKSQFFTDTPKQVVARSLPALTSKGLLGRNVGMRLN
jgi:hypothetical protein